MAEFQSIDDFLNFSGSESGGGGRVKGWKKSPGHMNWWCHQQGLPASVWYHNFAEHVSRTDKETGAQKHQVWSMQYVCHESEKTLKKQRFRNDDGTREHPPVSCGFCRSIELVRTEIREGRILDTDVIFEVTGADDASQNRRLTAGGFCSWWPRNPDDATKARLKQEGLYFGWAPGKPGVGAQSALAKLNYVIVGVNQDDVAGAVKVMVENQLIGDAIKKQIRDQIASRGDKGNPFINPYCLQLFVDDAAKTIGEKFGCRYIERFQITPEIERLLKTPRPSLARYLDPFDPTAMLTILQAAAVGKGKKIDFRTAFAVPEPIALPKREGSSRGGSQQQAPAAAEDKPKPQPSKPEDWGDPCDECKAPMKKGATKCTVCQTEYEADEAPATAAAAPTPPATEEKGDAFEDEGGFGGVPGGDDIPF